MFRYLIFIWGVLLDPLVATMHLRTECSPSSDTIYSYNATLLDRSREVDFSEYKGNVLLIVNTATYSDLTVASYQQINALADAFEGQDFEILAFPCRDFNKEELGANYDEVLNGIKYVRPGGGFKPKATFFLYVDVNGKNENPIYSFLKKNCPMVDTEYCSDCKNGLFYSPLAVGDVIWNFEKFLVGRDGKPYTRYHPINTNASALIPDITYLLSQNAA